MPFCDTQLKPSTFTMTRRSALGCSSTVTIFGSTTNSATGTLLALEQVLVHREERDAEALCAAVVCLAGLQFAVHVGRAELDSEDRVRVLEHTLVGVDQVAVAVAVTLRDL